jgi:hypothetical protein
LHRAEAGVAYPIESAGSDRSATEGEEISQAIVSGGRVIGHSTGIKRRVKPRDPERSPVGVVQRNASAVAVLVPGTAVQDGAALAQSIAECLVDGMREIAERWDVDADVADVREALHISGP